MNTATEHRCWPFFVVGLVLAGGVLWGVWQLGIKLELEFPYWHTLARARHATSVAGVPVTNIIDCSGDMRWHVCGYCAGLCGNREDLTHIELHTATATYHFAYSRTSDELVPMSGRTAIQYPLLMPTGDVLESVYPGVTSLGSDELKLPARWCKTGR